MNKRKRIIIFIFSIFFISTSIFAITPAPLSAEKEVQYQQIVLEEVNRYRSSKGLGKLILNEKISNEARQHSLNMAQKKIKFGHEDFDKRIIHIKKNIFAFGGGAENIACFKLPPDAVVQKWLTSRGHKRNIEGKYNLTGIGIVQDEKGWIYYTQIFVKENRNAVT